jgi:hypothetical protein
MKETLISWNGVKHYLDTHDLTREQRVDLLNYFNKQINAFAVEDCIVIQPTGMIIANGKQMSLEQREAFLLGAKSLLSNPAFNLIADQVMYQAMKVGIHDATNVDHLYFSKTALYFIDLFKKYLQKLDSLA